MGKLIIGVNDLETWCKQNGCIELLSEWDYEKNDNRKPSDIAFGTSKKMWWKCKKGHEWHISPNSRVKENKVYGCPYCSGIKPIPGETDLKTTHPELALEWNYEKNDTLTPSAVKAGSNKKVWWICSEGHEWPATIASRAINGNGCPYCSGRLTKSGFNDLVTWCKSNNRQYLLSEWDPANEIRPDQISDRNDKYAKWICVKGHHYEARIHNRTKGKGTGCPYCSHKKAIVGENDLETWCKANGRTIILDEWDNSKNIIKPTELLYSSGKKAWFKCRSCGYEWQTEIVKRTSLNRDCPCCSDKRMAVGENGSKLNYNGPTHISLEEWCKTNDRTIILDEWDYDKNVLSPAEVTYSSEKKAWFKCHICGNEWQIEVFRRTHQKRDCSACTKRIRSSFPEQCVFFYVSAAFPDAVNTDRRRLKGLELDVWVPSKHFAIEYDGKEWHKDIQRDLKKDTICNNQGITLYRIRETGCPKLVTTSSVIFECKENDWDELSTIVSEILLNYGITDVDVNISRDEYIIKEQYYKKSLNNSLENLYPELAKEWHPTKNKNITPNLVSAGTDNEYYWLCPRGHTYKSPCSRRIRGKGCPHCFKQNRLDTRIVGKTMVMRNGMKATVIADRNAMDIDVKFENGVIVRNKQRASFLKGVIGIPKTITGMKKIMKIGMAATVIADRGSNDVDIQFENGVVVNNCSRDSFRKGKISMPVNHSYQGLSKTMNNGLIATVIADRDESDIDVQFENGEIVKHSNRNAFRFGSIRLPQSSSIIGMKRIMHNGMSATVIADRGESDIDIEFENGVVVCNRHRDSFKQGKIGLPRKTSILGMKKKMKNGMTATVIADNGWDDIDIQFENGIVVRHKQRTAFKNGGISIKNITDSI